MTTREYLDEQLVAQETATNRRRLSDLRGAYAGRGIRLSESAAVTMCIREALPLLEKASTDLERLVVAHAVLPGAKRGEPLDKQLVIQETSANRARLAALCERYNASDAEPRKGNSRLLEASAVRLCIAVALPRLLQDAGAS